MKLEDYGHLKFLSDRCSNNTSLTSGTNAFEEFINWFIKYHNACILTVVTTRENKHNERYVYIEMLGVFTDLNKLAKRIDAEIRQAVADKFGKTSYEYKEYKPTADFFHEMLIIKHPWEDMEFQIVYTGVDETSCERHCEGWKYDLKTN